MNRVLKIITTGVAFGVAAGVAGVAIGVINSMLNGHALNGINISGLIIIGCKGAVGVGIAVVVLMLIGSPRSNR